MKLENDKAKNIPVAEAYRRKFKKLTYQPLEELTWRSDGAFIPKFPADWVKMHGVYYPMLKLSDKRGIKVDSRLAITSVPVINLFIEVSVVNPRELPRSKAFQDDRMDAVRESSIEDLTWIIDVPDVEENVRYSPISF
jgi:hypothetical protein